MSTGRETNMPAQAPSRRTRSRRSGNRRVGAPRGQPQNGNVATAATATNPPENLQSANANPIATQLAAETAGPGPGAEQVLYRPIITVAERDGATITMSSGCTQIGFNLGVDVSNVELLRSIEESGQPDNVNAQALAAEQAALTSLQHFEHHDYYVIVSLRRKWQNLQMNNEQPTPAIPLAPSIKIDVSLAPSTPAATFLFAPTSATPAATNSLAPTSAPGRRGRKRPATADELSAANEYIMGRLRPRSM